MNYVHSANIAYLNNITSKIQVLKKRKKNILMTFCIKNEDTKEVILKKKSYQNYRIIAHKNDDLWKIKNCT